ncbi:beta-ketoacyl synthase N-terminal-like domain-containing protein [Streptomyces sp. P17]|uniref:beta-ketoacyl synthase N-terminal-like domain-containing protein n=1 Tax=Streptomyces sp. P17 TaxID=3074716 RepID=UPI0028F3F70F|nr:beta-ketoacyl synthase N-terminal-like domain-containing protein [Streptomyces sp. P17]MDT9701439.1 beta-ketoacyl synthase N-terminal-like domain-containing protein [Streptomyces sp. P17]
MSGTLPEAVASVPSAAYGELAVTGVGVVSPWGASARDALAAGGAARPGAEGWFDHRARLGARGYKYLPPAAQYVLAAARAAVADGGRPDAVPADRRGLVLATGAGLAGVCDAMDVTVAEEGAGALSPATAPYFAVNVLGNRLAAELELKGFALTVATAGTAAADALSAGALALAAGRCDSLVLAAVEEPVPAGRGGGGQQGAVVFALEPPAAARARGARVHGTVRARSLFLAPNSLRDSAGRERAARRLGAALADLTGDPVGAAPAVHLDLDGSAVAGTVAAALGSPSGTAASVGCLAPALAVADALAAGGLVVAARGDGHVALVRVTPSVNALSSTGVLAC